MQLKKRTTNRKRGWSAANNAILLVGSGVEIIEVFI